MCHVFVVLRGVCFNGFGRGLRNEDSHWFCGKSNFIDAGGYMCFNCGVRLIFASNVFVRF